MTGGSDKDSDKSNRPSVEDGKEGESFDASLADGSPAIDSGLRDLLDGADGGNAPPGRSDSKSERAPGDEPATLFQPSIELTEDDAGKDQKDTERQPDMVAGKDDDDSAADNATRKLTPFEHHPDGDPPAASQDAETVPLSTLSPDAVEGASDQDSHSVPTRVNRPLPAEPPSASADRPNRPQETLFQPMVELDPNKDADNREGGAPEELTLPPVPDRDARDQSAPADPASPTRPMKPPPELNQQQTAVFSTPAAPQTGTDPTRNRIWLLAIPVVLLVAVASFFWFRPAADTDEQPLDDLSRVLELQSTSLERATQLSSKVTAVLTRSRQVRLELTDLDAQLAEAGDTDRQDIQERRNDLALLAEGLGEQAILIRDHVLANVDLAVVEQMAGALPVSPSDAELAELENRYRDLIEKLEQALQTQQRLELAVANRKKFLAAVARWRSFGFSWPVSPEDVERLSGRADGEGLQGFEFPDPSADAEVLLAAGRFEESAAAWAQGADDIGILVRQASERSELTDTRVRSLLASAELALESRQLTSPEDDNALLYYRQVLEIEPANGTALDGLGRIVSAYRALLEGAISAGRLDTAQTYLARAQSVDPQAGAVTEMQAQLERARGAWRKQRSEALMADMRDADARSDLSAADLALDELTALSADSGILSDAQQIRDSIAARPGRSFHDSLPGGLPGPDLVVLPTARFQMGTSGRQLARLFGAGRNESPAHPVDIDQPIAMARSEITVRDFGRFIADSGHVTDAEQNGALTVVEAAATVRASNRNWQHDFLGQQAAPDAPVIHVSWNDAQAYADWLARTTGQAYRLPSESEFEFALRAGLDDRFAWGNGDLREGFANLNGGQDQAPGDWNGRPDGKGELRRYRDGFFGPAPVASFAANAFGLHDMLGNVSEWVADCYLPDYKGKGPSQSPRFATDCSSRAVRGASWASENDSLRLSWRHSELASSASNTIGFRVVRELPEG